MKYFAFVIVVLTGMLLIGVTQDFPDWGDPSSPASMHTSPYYLKNAYDDTKTPNVVTAVLGDYRGFDTMLETSVVLVAGIAIMVLLRQYSGALTGEFDPVQEAKDRGLECYQAGIITKTTCNLLIPPMQLFALYVLMHGHYSPGGGFQGGVILGATLILHSLAHGLPATFTLLSQRKTLLTAYTGVAIYFGVGFLCLLLGANFLDYGVLAGLFSMSVPKARSLGVLVIETGVALTVMSVMFSIYADLVSSGKCDSGL